MLKSLNISRILLVLVILGPPVFRDQRSADTALSNPFAGLDASYLFHLATWALAFAFPVVLMISNRNWMSRIAKVLSGWSLRPYLLFGILAIVSSSYSINPLYTLFFALKLWTTLLLASLVTSLSDRDPVKELLRLVYIAFGIGWMILAAYLVFAPDVVGRQTSFGFRLTGGFLGDYGSFAMISGFGLLASMLYGWPYSKYRVWLPLIYSLSWLFVLLSWTRGTIISAFLGTALMVLLSKNTRIKIYALIISAIAVMVIVISSFTSEILTFMLRGQTSDQLAQLSGRTTAFDYLLNWWHQAPWLGQGYYAGSRNAMVSFVEQTGIEMGAAHDALSKVLVDLGLVGTVFIFGSLLLAWIAGIRMTIQSRDHIETFGITVQLLVLLLWFSINSGLSGGISDATGLESVTFLCIAILVKDFETKRKTILQAKRQVVY